MAGADSSLVSIDPSSGEVTLDSSANYEVKDSYSFDVIATDNGSLTDTQPVTISVTDVNEAPSISTGATGSVAENAATSTVMMLQPVMRTLKTTHRGLLSAIQIPSKRRWKKRLRH